MLADRGFGYQKLCELLVPLGWDLLIRLCGKIMVSNDQGENRTADQWPPATGRATMLKRAQVTAKRFSVPAVVVTWDNKIKEPWCLATTLTTTTAASVVKTYGRRFMSEATFRDQKDLHFGMGLKAMQIRKAHRRDRILLLAVVTHALLTLLGAAADRTRLDRYLKVTTVKRRTHSLYRQGLYWYGAIPRMRRDSLVPLMKAFDQLTREHASLCEIFGAI